MGSNTLIVLIIVEVVFVLDWVPPVLGYVDVDIGMHSTDQSVEQSLLSAGAFSFIEAVLRVYSIPDFDSIVSSVGF